MGLEPRRTERLLPPSDGMFIFDYWWLFGTVLWTLATICLSFGNVWDPLSILGVAGKSMDPTQWKGVRTFSSIQFSAVHNQIWIYVTPKTVLHTCWCRLALIFKFRSQLFHHSFAICVHPNRHCITQGTHYCLPLCALFPLAWWSM